MLVSRVMPGIAPIVCNANFHGMASLLISTAH